MLPGNRSKEEQLTLFDPPLRSEGTLRNVIGEFVECCTSALTLAGRCKTDSRAAVCPDLKQADKVWYECKSVGKNKAAIIHQRRLEKYRQFVLDGHQVFYWFWYHKGDFKKCETENQVRRQIAITLQSVFLVDAATIDRLCNSRQGTETYYSARFQDVGWRFASRDFQALRIARIPPLNVLGQPLPSVQLFATEEAAIHVRQVIDVSSQPGGLSIS